MNFLTPDMLLAYIASIFITLLPCSSAFHSPLESRCMSPLAASIHQRQVPLRRLRFAMVSDDSSNHDDNDASKDDDTMSASAQDLRSFVTQRCIQSFMFLLASTRDLHTVWWLDNFIQPITINNYDWDLDDEDAKPGSEDTFRENDKRLGSKLLNYHGLSALNTTIFPTWDSFFTQLLEQPDTVLMISTPKDVGKRVYSEIDIDIQPARLCTRILSVREQIARELTRDLESIANMGQQIFDSYRHHRKNRKDTKQAAGSDTDEESRLFAFDRPSTFYINFDPTDDDAFAPSPLRKGNFDLLYNLITQEAIVQLVEDGVVLGEDEAQNTACSAFLAQYYKDRLATHFVGSQWYGKGDDFIEGLMLSSPIIISRSSKGSGDEDQKDIKATSTPPLEIEPLRIAEQILLKRDKLAIDWMAIMKDTPDDHMEIRKAQLTRLTAVTTEEETVKVIFDEFQ